MSEVEKRAAERRAAVLAEIGQRQTAGNYERMAATVSAVDVEARTVELAFSSDTPVARWFGDEILSHEEGACDLSRLNNRGAVLNDHVWSDQVGVVLSARIDADGKGRAIVKLSRNAEGEALLIDLADGIKGHVSVGYFIHDARLHSVTDDDHETWIVTRWEPYEISFVSVPADVVVGVGRSAVSDVLPHPAAIAETTNEPATVPDNSPIEESKTRMSQVVETAESERERVRSINEIAANYGANLPDIGKMARTAADDGMPVGDFQRNVMEKLAERAAKPINEQIAERDVGLTDREVRQFSILNVVRALSDPSNKAAHKAAQFEFEVSAAARSASGKDSQNFLIPTDVLRRSVYGNLTGERAPMSAGTSGGADTGGYGIATDLHAQSFIEILRGRSTMLSMARVLGGLRGNVDIPRQSSAGSAFWLGAEDAESEETNGGLDQISLTPHTIAAFTEFTRKLLSQTSVDVEAMGRADLAIAAALGIDKAAYYGTGQGGEPLGIANLAGLSAQPFATAGKPTFAELVGMETTVASANADVGAMAYVANAKLRGYAKTATKFGSGTEATIWEPGNTLNGYRTEITNQIADGDVFFGNFSDVVVGMWGGLELAVDPYTHSRRGRIRVTMFQDVDFAHRHIESFVLGRAAP